MDSCVWVYYLAKRLGDLYFSKDTTTPAAAAVKTNCVLSHTHTSNPAQIHQLTQSLPLHSYIHINLNIGTKYVTGFAELWLLLLCVFDSYSALDPCYPEIDRLHLQMLWIQNSGCHNVAHIYNVYMGMKAKTRIEIKSSRSEANGYINIHPYVRTFTSIYPWQTATSAMVEVPSK